MKVIIAGSRDADVTYELISRLVEKLPQWPTLILSGRCRGVDAIGEEWAAAKGVPVEIYLANWEAYGKSAGPIRNKRMAEKADALVLIWDGFSRGSKNMLKEARDRGLVIVEHCYREGLPALKPVYAITMSAKRVDET